MNQKFQKEINKKRLSNFKGAREQICSAIELIVFARMHADITSDEVCEQFEKVLTQLEVLDSLMTNYNRILAMEIGGK